MTRFEKVSKAQFEKDWRSTFGVTPLDDVYDGIKLPRRATKFDAGYDFFAPVDLVIGPSETVTIPTGIRAVMDEGTVLLLMPRSGLGFKYRLQLDNTVGVIDAHYYTSDNEGHIMARLTNDSKDFRICRVDAGQAFMQGVLLPFLTMELEEQPTKERNGGFGSTDAEH